MGRIRQRINSLRNGPAVAAAGAGFVLNNRNEKVKEFPILHHFKGNPTTHILRFKNGELRKQGPGLSFWFRELNTSIGEVPLDDQELPFLFTSKSADFQDVTVQGVITYRIDQPDAIATRIDFSIELQTGRYKVDPKNKIESFLVQIAQESTTSYITGTPIATLLKDGVVAARDRIKAAFTTAGGFASEIDDLGLDVITVSVAAVTPRADVEKAMQIPAFETLQELADQATFDRRAKAVEKERQIQENELQNKVALAKTEAELIAQDGANRRKEAEEQAASQLIAANASAERSAVAAEAQAYAATKTGAAAAEALKSTLDVYKDADQKALNAATFRALAENLVNLQNLSITPDLLNQIADHLEAS